MIRSGQDSDKEAMMQLWRLCFPRDTERFVRFYFDRVYVPEQTLVLTSDGSGTDKIAGEIAGEDLLVAALQMIPYRIKTGDAIVWGGYISGAMTHPDHRRRGYMGQLLAAAFDRMRAMGYACAFLIPQQAHLIDYYGKFGFERAFAEHTVRWRCRAGETDAEDGATSAGAQSAMTMADGAGDGERTGEGRTERSELADRSRLISRSEVPVSGGRQLCARQSAARRTLSATCHHTTISTVDIPALYADYSRRLEEKRDVVLKSEAQFADILWDFFDQRGTLLVSDGGMAFALASGKFDNSDLVDSAPESHNHESDNEIILSEFIYRDEGAKVDLLRMICAHYPTAETIVYDDHTAPVTGFKGMIKPLLSNSAAATTTPTAPPAATHLGQMLD